jgi:hypothetical protein
MPRWSRVDTSGLSFTDYFSLPSIRNYIGNSIERNVSFEDTEDRICAFCQYDLREVAHTIDDEEKNVNEDTEAKDGNKGKSNPSSHLHASAEGTEIANPSGHLVQAAMDSEKEPESRMRTRMETTESHKHSPIVHTMAWPTTTSQLYVCCRAVTYSTRNVSSGGETARRPTATSVLPAAFLP